MQPSPELSGASALREERFFAVGPCGILCRLWGAGLPLPARFEAISPAEHSVDLELDITVESEPVWRPHSPDQPAFETLESGPTRLVLRRADADLILDLSAPHRVKALATIHPEKHALEAVIRIASSVALPRRGAMILHASAVLFAEEALLFTGESGAGKSTIASLLSRDGSLAPLADELLLLEHSPQGWRAAAAPFFAKVPTATRRPCRVSGLHFLEQAPANQRSSTSAAAALPRFCRNVLSYSRDATTLQQILDLSASFLAEVPSYQLAFSLEPQTPSLREVLEIS